MVISILLNDSAGCFKRELWMFYASKPKDVERHPFKCSTTSSMTEKVAQALLSGHVATSILLNNSAGWFKRKDAGWFKRKDAVCTESQRR